MDDGLDHDAASISSANRLNRSQQTVACFISKKSLGSFTPHRTDVDETRSGSS